MQGCSVETDAAHKEPALLSQASCVQLNESRAARAGQPGQALQRAARLTRIGGEDLRQQLRQACQFVLQELDLGLERGLVHHHLLTGKGAGAAAEAWLGAAAAAAAAAAREAAGPWGRPAASVTTRANCSGPKRTAARARVREVRTAKRVGCRRRPGPGHSPAGPASACRWQLRGLGGGELTVFRHGEQAAGWFGGHSLSVRGWVNGKPGEPITRGR